MLHFSEIVRALGPSAEEAGGRLPAAAVGRSLRRALGLRLQLDPGEVLRVLEERRLGYPYLTTTKAPRTGAQSPPDAGAEPPQGSPPKAPPWEGANIADVFTMHRPCGPKATLLSVGPAQATSACPCRRSGTQQLLAL